MVILIIITALIIFCVVTGFNLAYTLDEKFPRFGGLAYKTAATIYYVAIIGFLIWAKS